MTLLMGGLRVVPLAHWNATSVVNGVPAKKLSHDSLQCHDLEFNAHLPLQDVPEQLHHQLDYVRLACAWASVEKPTEWLAEVGTLVCTSSHFLQDSTHDDLYRLKLLRVGHSSTVWPHSCAQALQPSLQVGPASHSMHAIRHAPVV